MDLLVETLALPLEVHVLLEVRLGQCLIRLALGDVHWDAQTLDKSDKTSVSWYGRREKSLRLFLVQWRVFNLIVLATYHLEISTNLFVLVFETTSCTRLWPCLASGSYSQFFIR